MSNSFSLARRAGGFSLLEMVVAITILGFSLAALYRAAGGATRIVGVDEKMAYGVEIARSLVATHSIVAADGLQERGETEGGFAWEVSAEPLELVEESYLAPGDLQLLTVIVRWPDGGRQRQFSLDTVVAGMPENP